MRGLMMDFPLTIGAILRHAEQVAACREIVTRLPDRTLHRYAYGDFAQRARKLAGALGRLGVEPGDRVATLAWNHGQHLEAYFGVPLTGAVLHTLNLRLSPDELAFIVNDAGDRVVIVDETLLPLWDEVRQRLHTPPLTIVVGSAPPGALEYEALIDPADPLEDGGSDGRVRRCGDVLHDRDDRLPQGRALLAPLARAAHARHLARIDVGHRRARRVDAGGPDVPCERVGTAVRRGAGRRQARDAGPTSRSPRASSSSSSANG